MQRPPVPPLGESMPLRKSTWYFSADDASIGNAFDPAISPDGQHVAYVSEGRLWVHDLSAIDPKVIVNTAGVVEPFWSPDGEWIGFGVESQLRKVRRDGGEVSQITTLPAGIQLGAASSAVWGDDDVIVIGPATAGLYSVSANGGTATLFLPPGDGETDFHEVCGLPGRLGWAVVVHNSDGIGNIDLVRPDKSRVVLLRISDSVGHPSYSPSGHIVFIRNGSNPGIWAFTISPETGERTGEPFIVAPGGREPSVSADGTLVYTRGTQTQEVQLVALDRTGEVTKEIGLPTSTHRPFPELSPDGESIALSCDFGDGRELYIYDVASGNRRRLTFNDLREDFATWYPDGNKIFFYESNAYSTSVMSLDGTGGEHVYPNCIMCDVTADEALLVCARQEPGQWNWDIYIVPAESDGSDATRIVSTDATDWWPRLSPNGKYLAYVSNETGRDEVFVTTFPNPTTRWQISTEGGEWPRWRKGGREIIYTTRVAIMAAAVTSEAGFSVGPPTKLFDRPVVNWSSRWADGWDVTADGQTFYMHRRSVSDSDVDPAIVIVQNWFAEFAGSAQQ